MLPRLDGLEVCKRLRAQSTVPIIMLTARDDELDKVLGLELGADDYITKPFSIREFRSRVRALLRRAAAPRPGDQDGDEVIDVAGVRIDVPRRTVVAHGRDVQLTFVEFELLACSRPRRGGSSRAASCSSGCAGDRLPRAARRRPRAPSAREDRARPAPPPELIMTVRGVGYRFRGGVDGQAPCDQGHSPPACARPRARRRGRARRGRADRRAFQLKDSSSTSSSSWRRTPGRSAAASRVTTRARRRSPSSPPRSCRRASSSTRRSTN